MLCFGRRSLLAGMAPVKSHVVLHDDVDLGSTGFALYGVIGRAQSCSRHLCVR